jgi:hypothetical protein
MTTQKNELATWLDAVTESLIEQRNERASKPSFYKRTVMKYGKCGVVEASELLEIIEENDLIVDWSESTGNEWKVAIKEARAIQAVA